MSFSRLRPNCNRRHERTVGSYGRQLRFEQLEDRQLLSVSPSNAADPSASESPALPIVMANGFQLTTTASTAPVYLNELVATDDQPVTNVIQSRPLINLDAFRADPRFAGINGSGFSSVIIDTGIDLNHPFFGPDANSNGIDDRIVFQYDFSGTNDSNASDVDGHGSNVASIVASQDATYNGMAPGTNIIALKVFTDAGSGSFADVEEALQWVVANASTYNIASVNMSLGDSGNYNVAGSLDGLGDELAALNAENVIVVSAAGNDYFEFQQQGVSYPASDANSLAVSAVWDGNNGGPITWSDGARDNTTGADRITSFSQRSTTMTSIFAPGAFITGANQSGGTVTEAGTSQASPHIAGIATLAQQLATQVLGRRLSMAEFKSLLNSSGVTIFDGDDEDDNVTNTQQNYRRVDVLALGNAIWSMGIPGVDLAGTQFSVAPANLRGAGGLATANLTVRNLGNTAAPAFDVKFYLSDDATIDPNSDMLLTLDPSAAYYDAGEPSAYHVTGGLAPLGSLNAAIKVVVPISDPFATDNQYYLGMVVDADGNVAEADEANNRNRGDGADRQIVTYSNTFTNPASIAIPDSGAASPYPSNISVAGLMGTVADVNVSLFGFTHTFPDDIDILLVGPAGQKMILLSDVGGSVDISGVNLVLDDSAASSLPNSSQLTSGTFKPTNIGSGDTFTSPAPAGPYSAALSVFNGTNPNGTWSLYVLDDAGTDLGSFSGGWGLTFVLNNTPPTNPTNVSLPAIVEDISDGSNTGRLVSTIVSSSGSTDADGNPLGISVTSADNSHGQWQYSTNGGANWQDIVGVSLTSARLLGPAYYERFVPTANYNSSIAASATLGFKVWDQSSGALGGTANTTTGTAFSAASALATQSVSAVNDAPSFTLTTTLVSANEDADAVSVSSFATNIKPGPTSASDEAGQALAFLVGVGAMTGTLSFDVAPSINPVTGALSFKAAANTNGTATIDVVLQDNGSGTPPNVNQSAAQQFTIQIAAVNDTPSYALASAVVEANEDAGAVAVSGFAGNIVPGPATATDEAGQVLTFLVSVGSTTDTLSFDVAPAIDPVTGALSFKAAANTNGAATIDVVLQDNGSGTPPNVNQSSAQQFTIEIAAVNDAPSFTLASTVVAANEDAGAFSVSGFASNIVPGPATATDEAGQVLTFLVSVGGTTGTLSFDAAPAIDPITGALSFTTAANTNGTATIDVVLQDNGSGTPPNVNQSSAQQFTIEIAAVNDAPSFTLASTVVAANEDAGAFSVSGFASNIVPGPATASDEVGQSLTFLVSVGGTTGTLSFDVAPAIDPVTGALSFTTAANTNGTATIDVALQDNGNGTPPNVNVSAAQQFSVEIASVNDEQVLATNAGLTVDQGSVAAITTAMLEATDVDDPPADLLYTVSAGPLHGIILVNATPATQFSQQQIDTGLVSYENDGTANSTDSFAFAVDDGEGTASSGTFNISIRPNPGDYDQDLLVSAADYVTWRKAVDTTGSIPYSGADGNGDTTVDEADYDVWREHFGETVAGASGASIEGGVGSGEAARSEERGASVEMVTTTTLAEPVAPEGKVQAVVSIGTAWQASDGTLKESPRTARLSVTTETGRDEALLAWVSSRDYGRAIRAGQTDGVAGGHDCLSDGEAIDGALHELFESIEITV